MTDRRKLRQLTHALSDLVALLKLDPASPWAAKFQGDLSRSQELLEGTPSDDSLVELSQSIMRVYKGMGSFNDYAPTVYDPDTGRYTVISGTESFEDTAKEVFEAALSLRVPR